MSNTVSPVCTVSSPAAECRTRRKFSGRHPNERAQILKVASRSDSTFACVCRGGAGITVLTFGQCRRWPWFPLSVQATIEMSLSINHSRPEVNQVGYSSCGGCLSVGIAGERMATNRIEMGRAVIPWCRGSRGRPSVYAGPATATASEAIGFSTISPSSAPAAPSNSFLFSPAL